jgi:molybdopterin molybdotransferase
MLELEEALARVLAAVPAPTSESVLLNDAAGRVLAEAIQSPIDLPIFDNSSMDGYRPKWLRRCACAWPEW